MRRNHDAEDELLEREVGPARRRLSLRRAFQRMGRGAQASRTRRSTISAPAPITSSACGRPNARATPCSRITASKEEYDAYITLVTENAAGGEILSRLFRRHLSDQSAAAAGLRRRDDVPSVRVLLPNTASPEYGGTRPIAACSTCSPPRPARAGTFSSTQARTAWQGAADHRRPGKSEQPVERVDDFKTLLVYRKTE